jgi:ketosteroid isomerase-like protein
VAAPTTAVRTLIAEYATRYSAHDVDGVANLCVHPFVAIRDGATIHLADESAVHDHFAAIMNTYRGSGASVWAPIEIDAHELGDVACFASVRWNAHDANGVVVRDTWTTYHAVATPEGWRFLSYTNHF